MSKMEDDRRKRRSNDPFRVVHEVDHWVWFIIPVGRKLNGYQVQVSALGFRIIALL
jgi:hypothetical protein